MSRLLTGSLPERKAVDTAFGAIAYLQSGHGPAALFVHGVFLNAGMWEHQLADLDDVRTCIAVDLLAHGESAVPGPGKLTIGMQSEMVLAFLDALELEEFDLVGSDSGGAIAQLVAVRAPHRVRSLTLTNCDTHNNWPPTNFAPIHKMASQGRLAETLEQLATDAEAGRAVLASSFEDAAALPDAVLTGFFGPFADLDRARAVQDQVVSMDSSITVAIREQLEQLRTPTLIAWGDGDEFFDVSWARWLERTIPGTVRKVELEGAKLFHPAERPEVLNRELRELWANAATHRFLSEYLDAWNRHDLDDVMALHTSDTVFTRHVGPATYVGEDAVLQAFKDDLAQALSAVEADPTERHPRRLRPRIRVVGHGRRFPGGVRLQRRIRLEGPRKVR